jgi:hypothetical protein
MKQHPEKQASRSAFSPAPPSPSVLHSDNSFPVRIVIENTPPLNPMMPMPGTGEDRFSIVGNFAANLELSLFMVESHLGSNPLSSNDLPTTEFGSGPGTWSTSELDIDRTDVFGQYLRVSDEYRRGHNGA